MALTDEGTGTTMLVQPSGFGGNGMGWGGDWAWIIILLLAFNGGWGNGFGGGNELYPWLNQSNQVADGFANQANGIALNGIQGSISALQPQLCNGFSGVTAAVTGAQNALSQQMYTTHPMAARNMAIAALFTPVKWPVAMSK